MNDRVLDVYEWTRRCAMLELRCQLQVILAERERARRAAKARRGIIG